MSTVIEKLKLKNKIKEACWPEETFPSQASHLLERTKGLAVKKHVFHMQTNQFEI